MSGKQIYQLPAVTDLAEDDELIVSLASGNLTRRIKVSDAADALALLMEIVMGVADNSAFTDGTTDVTPAGFILDETAGTSLTENDVGAGRMDSKRAQVITIEDATTRGRRLTISASGEAATTNAILDAVVGAGVVTCSVDITRPANTTQYAADDAWADSTPTAGGFTFSGAARATGKAVILTDLVIVSSNAAATPLQGEIWIFDTAPTAISDNAAFTVSDAEAKTLVARIPFVLTTIGANSSAHLSNLGIAMTTVGSADLRGLVRVMNAYTPVSGEVLTVRAKFLQVN